jgi:hypothetical protein
MPNALKRKVTRNDAPAVKRPRRPDAADRVFSTSELLGRIISFVPRSDITLIQRVSKRFLAITKFGPIQEYLHHVPSNSKAGGEVLQFRGERISDFLRQVSLPPDSILVPTRESCIQGFGGEDFIDKDDKAYRRINEKADSVLRNTQCAKPCLLEQDFSSCNLNPGPFKRIVCALLLAAWNAKAEYPNAMQPGTFQITCDARTLQNIEWSEYRMGGTFSQPPPENTFEATINWVFMELSHYTISRIGSFGYAKFANNKDCAKAMVLCQAQIWKEFRIARSMSWTLEQVCYIVERIPEEHFVCC